MNVPFQPWLGVSRTFEVPIAKPAPSNLELTKPEIPGLSFTVTGTGPFVLGVQSGRDAAIIEVEDDKFPAAAWELLINQFLKRFENV